MGYKRDEKGGYAKDENGKYIRVPLLEAWGQKLPFTIMLDTEGTTTKAWGVSAYPTVCLVDPEGKLVATGERQVEEMLAKKLKGEEEPAKEPAKEPGKMN